jgi:hypothetical protein
MTVSMKALVLVLVVLVAGSCGGREANYPPGAVSPSLCAACRTQPASVPLESSSRRPSSVDEPSMSDGSVAARSSVKEQNPADASPHCTPVAAASSSLEVVNDNAAYFTVKYSCLSTLAEVPAPLVAELTRKLAERERGPGGDTALYIAERGADFNATDNGGGGVPFRRFIVGGLSKRFGFVAYEHGGVGYHHHVAIFELRRAGSGNISEARAVFNAQTFLPERSTQGKCDLSGILERVRRQQNEVNGPFGW